MKKLLYFLFLMISFYASSQKITEQQAEKATDVKTVAAFLKQNPNHPRTAEFKQKLISIMNGNKTPAQRAAIAKPTVKPLGKTTSGSYGKSSAGVSAENKKTADMLTHLFNNDPNKKDAYVQIVNKSKCNLLIKISGKKFYNLTVPANKENFILVDKGNYTMSTSICDAKYSAKKSINSDISITLNAPNMAKKK